MCIGKKYELIFINLIHVKKRGPNSHIIKKQHTLSWLCLKVQYSNVTSTTKLNWLSFLVHDINVCFRNLTQSLCGNTSDFHMSINHVFHNHIKIGPSLCS